MIQGQFQKWYCTLTPNFRALRPTFEKLFTGPNVGRRARKIGTVRKTVYETDTQWAAKTSLAYFFSLIIIWPIM